jgi:hypothetical protein
MRMKTGAIYTRPAQTIVIPGGEWALLTPSRRSRFVVRMQRTSGLRGLRSDLPRGLVTPIAAPRASKISWPMKPSHARDEEECTGDLGV